MKAYELLKVNESLLKAMDGASLAIGDIKYVNMVYEFEQMIAKGDKKTYIVQTLAEKYEIAERTLYRVIERLMQDILPN